MGERLTEQPKAFKANRGRRFEREEGGVLVRLVIALERVGSFGTEVLVVALGLDASIDDPFKGFAVTQDGFARIGAAIAKAGLPTLFVQEGGYLSPSLGANLTRTLTGFQGG